MNSTQQIWDDAIESKMSCEVLIIGSGAGGSPTAALLAEAGFDVLVVEEGRWVEQGKETFDYSRCGGCGDVACD